MHCISPRSMVKSPLGTEEEEEAEWCVYLFIYHTIAIPRGYGNGERDISYCVSAAGAGPTSPASPGSLGFYLQQK